MKTKRTEVSFESREVWRIHPAAGNETRQCPICPGASPMILAEELARASSRSPREVYREIERGRVHFFESPNAQMYVCLASFSEMN